MLDETNETRVEIPGSSPVRVVLRNNLPSKRGNSNNRRGIIAADSPTAEKWTYKRMSRSFDNHEAIEQAFQDAMAHEEDDEMGEETKTSVVQSKKIQRYLNVSFLQTGILKICLFSVFCLTKPFENCFCTRLSRSSYLMSNLC